MEHVIERRGASAPGSTLPRVGASDSHGHGQGMGLLGTLCRLPGRGAAEGP